MKFKVGDEVIVVNQLGLANLQYPYRNGCIFVIGEINREYDRPEYSAAGDRSWYTTEETIRPLTPLDKLL